MAIRLCLILCTSILIAKPSGILILEYHQVSKTEMSAMTQERQQPASEKFWEPEMPLIWLVRNPKAFGTKGETSATDRSLGLRLDYREWLAIYFDAFGLDKSGFEETAARLAALGQGDSFLTSFDEEIPGFPLLSRIRGPYHDVIFEHDELEDLHKECLRVKSRTKNALALRGLDKLIHAYDQARQLGLSIYFVSN